MTRRKVTMLEAFQDSARTSQERQDAALSRTQAAAGDGALGVDNPLAGDPLVGDPLAGEGRADPRPAPSVHDGPAIVPVGESSVGGSASGGHPGVDSEGIDAEGRAARTGLTLPFSGYGFAVLQVLLLVGAFLLGRQFEEHGFGLGASHSSEASGQARLEAASFGMPGRSLTSRQLSGAVDAGARAIQPERQTGAPGEAGTPGGGGSPEGTQSDGVAAVDTSSPSAQPDPDTAADQAFWDPAMRFTVLAISYTRSPANEALAWETYDLLAELGFPVVKPSSGGIRIFLHVGAAASMDELADLRNELQNVRVGPRRTPDFRTAYVVNINREID